MKHISVKKLLSHWKMNWKVFTLYNSIDMFAEAEMKIWLLNVIVLLKKIYSLGNQSFVPKCTGVIRKQMLYRMTVEIFFLFDVVLLNWNYLIYWFKKFNKSLNLEIWKNKLKIIVRKTNNGLKKNPKPKIKWNWGLMKLITDILNLIKISTQ